MARAALMLSLVLCCSWIGSAQDPKPEPKSGAKPEVKPESLLKEGEITKTWTYFTDDKTKKFDDTWKFVKGTNGKDSYLVCSGKPTGYLRTVKLHDNFEFGLEWKYPEDQNGNSGILIHTAKENKIWPAAIQVQLHRPAVGSVFPVGGGKSANVLTVKDLLDEKTVGKWNKCVISSRDGKLSVTINGKKVGEVTGCMPVKGSIALQSEGSEIHFRNIWIRQMAKETAVTKKDATDNSRG